MKVFLDTEFYEFQPSTPCEGRSLPGANAVQLISIGAVREDGAKFYAENSEFDWNNVPRAHWLQYNVRPRLAGRGEERTPEFIASSFRRWASPFEPNTLTGSRPEFWAYYADYDWVVLCGLYGRMIDLPPEFPMYCNDLKQEMDRLGVRRSQLPDQDNAHNALDDAKWVRKAYEELLDEGLQDLRSAL